MGPNFLDIPPRVVSLPNLTEVISSNINVKVSKSLAWQSKLLHDVGELDLQLCSRLFLTARI